MSFKSENKNRNLMFINPPTIDKVLYPFGNKSNEPNSIFSIEWNNIWGKDGVIKCRLYRKRVNSLKIKC